MMSAFFVAKHRILRVWELIHCVPNHIYEYRSFYKLEWEALPLIWYCSTLGMSLHLKYELLRQMRGTIERRMVVDLVEEMATNHTHG
jgi:lipid-A-disaccharide synthase-like uncharacterized protein